MTSSATNMTSSLAEIFHDHLTCRAFTKSEAPELLEEVLHLRQLVYAEEQQLPEWVVNDVSDDTVLHVAAVLDDDGNHPTVVGAVRLQPVLEKDGNRTAKVERVLVAKEQRGSGVGALVMRTLLDEARRRGFSGAVLEGATYTNGFYEKFGFRIEGKEFIKIGLPFNIMRMTF